MSIDAGKLRGWAKEAQKRIEALERASLGSWTQTDYIRYKPVPYEPIPPQHKVSFYARRKKLCQVQIWTSAGQDEQGNHLLCSLDWPESIEAVAVYLATH